jgi:GNAT superfamily N-acetyltransferase
MGTVKIEKLMLEDLKSAEIVFETAIPDAFVKEGLTLMDEAIQNEISSKKQMLVESLEDQEGELRFLVAKLDHRVIGTISFGPCGNDILKCTDNALSGVGELGSLYVLPEYQNKGVGSSLIHAMLQSMHENNISQFCLDSGYKRAQKRWIRKFGKPYKVVEDYWGPGFEHMIWLCRVDHFTPFA